MAKCPILSQMVNNINNLGTIIFTCVILIVNIKILFCFKSFTGYEFLCVFISFVNYYLILLFSSLFFVDRVYLKRIYFYTYAIVGVVSFILITDLGTKYVLMFFGLIENESFLEGKDADLDQKKFEEEEDESNKDFLKNYEEDGKMQLNYRKIIFY